MAFLEDISTGLISPTQSLEQDIQGYCKLTRACWPFLFALSSSLSVRAPLVNPPHLKPPMNQVRTSCSHFVHPLPVYLMCALLSIGRQKVPMPGLVAC